MRQQANWRFVGVALLLAACLAAILGVTGFLLVQIQQGSVVAKQTELEVVQRLAGGLLQSHPELEGEFVEILRETNEEYRQEGAGILRRYGYKDLQNTSETLSFFAQQQNRTVILLLLLTLGLAILAWAAQREWQKGQNRMLGQVLDEYLAGNFRFAESAGTPKMLGAALGDKLRRLGNLIRVDHHRLIEEKEATKALVTDLSHQLKTPVAALKTSFELYEEAESGQEQEEFKVRTVQQIDKLESLTETLMNLSRLETAMIQLNPENIQLEPLLRTAVNGVYHKAAAKGVAVESEEIEPMQVRGDAKWTAEALTNLLDNAVKYSPPDSVVQIRAEKRMQFARVEIEDKGIGISREEQNKIFGRFYRGESSRVRQEEGAGVGLYLSRYLLEELGGTVSVRSSLGQGSIFVVQLPLVQPVSKR